MKTLLRLLAGTLLLITLTACVTSGKPGTPLPPQDKKVGDKWPPEVKQAIDSLFTTFVRESPMPSEAEITRALQLKLSETNTPGYFIEIQKRVQSWPLGEAKGNEKHPPVLLVEEPSGYGQFVFVELPVDTQRYCINPYDFAVYSGLPFQSHAPRTSPLYMKKHSDHDNRYGPGPKYQYVFGMFERQDIHDYYNPGPIGIQLSNDNRCIVLFNVQADFEDPQMSIGEGKPGTPLPPMDKKIGEKWPAEVRTYIDTALTLFGDGASKRSLSEQDIEQAFHGRLVAGQTWIDGTKNWDLHDSPWPRNDPPYAHYEYPYFSISPVGSDGRQKISMIVNPGKVCINPYDFAVYTGHRFVRTGKLEWDDKKKKWAPPPPVTGSSYLYEWGMFNHTLGREYSGNTYKSNKNEQINSSVMKKRCVELYTVEAYFQAPDQAKQTVVEP